MWNPFRKRRDSREVTVDNSVRDRASGQHERRSAVRLDAIPEERPAIDEEVSEGRGEVTIFNAVVREPATGLHELRFVITVDHVADAGPAIIKEFSKWISILQKDKQWGGAVTFVVRGPTPGSEVPAELIPVQAQLDAKVSTDGLKTASGKPLRQKIEYKKSAF